MLLINVAMVKFAEGDLIQAKVRTGRLLIHAMEQNVGYLFLQRKTGLKGIDSDPIFRKNTVRLLDYGGFSESVIIDHRINPIFTTGLSAERKKRGVFHARESMGTGALSINYSGSSWGVFWLNKKDISISAPLVIDGRALGGITVSSSLDSVYQILRKSEKVILFYILLDTIILATVGIYLLSRIVVKPIYKLLKMTEEYKDGDIIPSFTETPRNEIGNLSRSLSVMLKRLDENKGELKAHISSLEKANIELKQAQNEIIRSEKLVSVGRLAAGIAHEIGNPIGIILGYLELIRKGDISDEEEKDFLNRVESEITRINLIIKQLLDFSRPSSRKQEKNHIHDLIMDTISMLKPQPMMEEISILFELQATRDTVLADPNELKQVFLNIIMNAADILVGGNSMGDKAQEKGLTIKSKDTDDAIEIRFTDNGPGISEEELGRIFDPFYTTKEPGKGTGLGLSVCYRIIEGQGGTISAESPEGEGTTVIINFPLYEKKHGDNGE